MIVPDFETLLPRLVATYESGRLVPFVGSGMSRTACTDWPTFIGRLEAAAAIAAGGLGPATARDELVRRANRAVRVLKGREPGAFSNAVRAALQADAVETPPMPLQTQALARLWWPLILTTNYDDCIACALHDRFPDRPLAVVGRGTEDCQRVLGSLSTAGRSLIWALQGYLQDLPYVVPSDRVEVSPGLDRQLVVGHEEYRRVTHREPHFRRAFAEVFRQRSLLFLGAGLQESYLQELFGEVLEFFGPATRPHYALIQQGEVDPEFMLARFQIVVVEYPTGEHTRIREWLGELAEAVAASHPAPLAWTWGQTERDPGRSAGMADLQVVRGPLPPQTVPGDCLAVSAGGSGDQFFFSPGIRQVLTGWQVDQYMPGTIAAPYLGEFEGRSVVAVRARSENDERSLAHVYDASWALFDRVADRFPRIHMQLLATGGHEKIGVPQEQWKVRQYPERFSFVQTVRAWAAWRRAHPQSRCRLVLYVVNDAVTLDLASGRIDVLELLGCVDVRFFAEVVAEDGRFERRLYQTRVETSLRELVDDLQLAPGAWEMKVTPPPDANPAQFALLDADNLSRSLQTLGVVPGSTVHFRRPTRGAEAIDPAAG